MDGSDGLKFVRATVGRGGAAVGRGGRARLSSLLRARPVEPFPEVREHSCFSTPYVGYTTRAPRGNESAVKKTSGPSLHPHPSIPPHPSTRPSWMPEPRPAHPRSLPQTHSPTTKRGLSLLSNSLPSSPSQSARPALQPLITHCRYQRPLPLRSSPIPPLTRHQLRRANEIS